MAIDTETRLAPCPFCGNENLLLRDTEYDRTLWIIECGGCDMEFAVKHRDLIHGKKSTHDDLVKAWNTRANPRDAAEPVKTVSENGFRYWHCGKCGSLIRPFEANYCSLCGTKVIWNGEDGEAP